MSFDLAVFRPTRALDDAAAQAVYVALCDTTPARRAEAEVALAVEAKLDAFYAALTATYPELDDDEDDSPFACAIERRPYAVILNVSFSRADEVAHAVETLAKAQGLDTFDPQTGKLLRARDPEATPRPAPKAKLTPKEGQTRFVSGLWPRLEALGFLPVPRAKHTWGRTLANGVLHRVSLNLGTRDVRPNVAVGHAQALAWLAAATGEKELLPTMGLQYLYFRGWIPGKPWRDEEPGDFNYAICHGPCVTAAVDAFAGELADYGIPFFDKLDTVAALEDFFQRREPYSTARPNWGIARERLAGPAARFWRQDRGLLLAVAVGALANPSATSRLLEEARGRVAAWAKEETFGWSPKLASFVDGLEAAMSAESKTAKAKTAKAKR